MELQGAGIWLCLRKVVGQHFHAKIPFPDNNQGRKAQGEGAIGTLKTRGTIKGSEARRQDPCKKEPSTMIPLIIAGPQDRIAALQHSENYQQGKGGRAMGCTTTQECQGIPEIDSSSYSSNNLKAACPEKRAEKTRHKIQEK